jgi:peptidyl-prolyl cis-trans isomerase SurA
LTLTRPPHGSALALSILAFVLALVATLAGCARKAPSDREVWAEVDGAPIFREEVEKRYRSRMAPGSDAGSEEQALSLKLNVLNELINNQILLAHAAHSQITVSEAEVDTKVAQLESPYSKEEFQRKLSEQGLDPNDLRQQVRESLIIDKLINKEIASRLTVTDGEIAAYYERNRASFDVPETHYHLAQIAVTPTAEPKLRNLKNDDARSPAAARRKIQMLYIQLQAGADFAVVAQQYSEDPKTASGGGDMGFIPASSIATNPQLNHAVESLKVGEISPIIQTSDGFHIIKLLGREEPGQHPISDPQVQSAIRRTLTSEKEELLKAAYIEDLRNHAKVANHLAEKIVGGSGTATTK